MKNKYKIVISNRNLYHEVELPVDAKTYKIGTSIDCDFRLHKEYFFEDIRLDFTNENDNWYVMCSDNIYITTGDTRRLLTMELKHGDIIIVKYQESNNDVFDMEFMVDFDSKNINFERKIYLGNIPKVSIGAAIENDIVLLSSYIINDKIELSKRGTDVVLNIIDSSYGVYHNGNKINDKQIIKNGDFISISDYVFYYKDNALWTEIENNYSIKNLTFMDYPVKNSYPMFVRNTRLKTAWDEEDIEILDSPEKPQKPENNLLMSLMPAMGMLIVSGIMSFMGGMMAVFGIISAIMAVITSVTSIIQGNKDYKKQISERIEKYNIYIKNKREEIEKKQEAERELLNQIYISKEEKFSRFNEFSSDLFDRNKEDDDFIDVRLGIGSIKSTRKIKYKKQERLEIEDDLQKMPEDLCDEYEKLDDAPIVCDFKNMNALGITGHKKNRYELLKTIVFDIITRQFHFDVKMFFIVSEKDTSLIKNFRFLPHIDHTIENTKNIVCDEESKKVVFEFLYNELTKREQEKGYDEHYIIFFYDQCGFASHPISRFVNKAKELGVIFIFFSDEIAGIPMGCDKIISLINDSEAEIIDSEDVMGSSNFQYEKILDEEMSKIVQIMSAVETEEISLEGSLTKSISFFDMLNILGVEDLDLKKRWEATEVYKTMSVPIGVSKTETVYLDLHDKAHGPHGLVAGTTGSGKSEILQTYILSIATYFHPYEVAFVIIDFKGGGMVNQFKDLPHLLGSITNIEGKEIERSLKSIKAELQKRQRLFAETEVNHIDAYIRKFKLGEVSTPLPHLVIIVDEFAELKAEQPEFMKELISAARIGRSLGVHLILATQKPSGQVNEQIWSNSRFKLCLKVQGQEDSNEVLKSPLAAEIKEPGRAYLQVGNNEIFELFQSAYSGAPEKTNNSKVKEFTIFGLTESGRREPLYSQKKKKSDKDNTNQLDAVVKYVSNYCNNINLPQLPDICLPSLSECIEFDVKKRSDGKTSKYSAEIGIYDDPDNQYQGRYSVDLESNNLMIIGSSQSGKTNVLQNIIRSITTKYSPDDASIYIIDFASMVLKNFEKLNHVGGVVSPSEDEKLKNLFKLLYTEIESRKEKLMSFGVSSFSAYKEAGETDLPLMILIIDNITALKELYFQDDDDELLNICREGLAVGVSIVIANLETAGIGYKYLSNFSARIAMFCNDSNEYGSLFDHCRKRIDAIPGRCIIEVDKTYYECQSYLSFKGEKEFDRVQDIKKYISQTNDNNKGSIAKKIPLIPSSLTKNFMVEQFGGYMEEPFSIVAGLDYATVTPYVLDFASTGLLAISGRENAGRHNWLKYVIDMLDTIYQGRSKVYLVDSIRKKLSSMKSYDNLVAYSIIAEDAITYIKEIERQLEERYDALVADDESVFSNAELLLLIIDNLDAIDYICNDSDALASYKNIVGRYKNMKACIITFVENANIPYSAPEIMKDIREQRNFMYFDDMVNMKIFDIPLALSRNFKKPIEIGDGYYIRDNECIKLKTARCISKKVLTE